MKNFFKSSNLYVALGDWTSWCPGCEKAIIVKLWLNFLTTSYKKFGLMSVTRSDFSLRKLFQDNNNF